MYEETDPDQLREKLEKIKRDKMFALILFFPAMFLSLLFLSDLLGLWKNYTYAFLAWTIIGGTSYLVMDRYYSKKEAETFRQLRKTLSK